MTLSTKGGATSGAISINDFHYIRRLSQTRRQPPFRYVRHDPSLGTVGIRSGSHYDNHQPDHATTRPPG